MRSKCSRAGGPLSIWSPARSPWAACRVGEGTAIRLYPGLHDPRKCSDPSRPRRHLEDVVAPGGEIEVEAAPGQVGAVPLVHGVRPQEIDEAPGLAVEPGVPEIDVTLSLRGAVVDRDEQAAPPGFPE